MIQPIWKNYFVSLGNVDSAEYVVGYVADGYLHPFYSGNAFKRPDSESLEICINDICADWLRNTLPSLSEGFSRNDMPVEFVVQTISESGQYVERGRVRFINDWSYDAGHDALSEGLSAPVNGHVDARQWIMWTGVDVEEVEAEVTFADGETMKVFVPVKTTADFSQDFSQDFAKSLGTAGGGTAVFLPKWEGAVKVSVNGLEYTIVNTCSRYALYYMNAFGGWDGLLIEGASSEHDAITRHMMDKSGIYDRQKSNYLNEIQKRVTLHTSWLSDAESLKMHHLLNSTDVYLHDMEKNVIIPVVLESGETPYKTYKGQGGKLVNYTIDVTVAKTMMRR